MAVGGGGWGQGVKGEKHGLLHVISRQVWKQEPSPSLLACYWSRVRSKAAVSRTTHRGLGLAQSNEKPFGLQGFRGEVHAHLGRAMSCTGKEGPRTKSHVLSQGSPTKRVGA